MRLAAVQVDNEPSIRANTTVLLGNIANYLGDVYCKKVGVLTALKPAQQEEWLHQLC